jgi:hypothetical protein
MPDHQMAASNPAMMASIKDVNPTRLMRAFRLRLRALVVFSSAA